MFVDSHAHLDDKAFDADREQAIERAHAAGVRYLLVIGGGNGPDDFHRALSVARKHESIYAALGIHPHEAARVEELHFERLREAAKEPKVLAIGEIGLDYYYDHSPREVQKRVLIPQLELARELKLPVVVHCRDAWADLRETVRDHWQAAALGGILHCFTGSREDAKAFLDWGFLVSFAGIVTFPKSENLRAVARTVPLDRVLTETDSPYLAPVPHRGKRNEPAYVVEVTKALAALHSLAGEEMGRQAVTNFQRFFRLAKSSTTHSR